MLITSISDFRRAVRNGPYAWPGGYPLYWVMADGGACEFKVCKTERKAMLRALAKREARDEWRPVELAVNWENTELYCDHTSNRIEAAYED